jgi:hypothetical protein
MTSGAYLGCPRGVNPGCEFFSLALLRTPSKAPACSRSLRFFRSEAVGLPFRPRASPADGSRGLSRLGREGVRLTSPVNLPAAESRDGPALFDRERREPDRAPRSGIGLDVGASFGLQGGTNGRGHRSTTRLGPPSIQAPGEFSVERGHEKLREGVNLSRAVVALLYRPPRAQAQPRGEAARGARRKSETCMGSNLSLPEAPSNFFVAAVEHAGYVMGA